VPEVVAADLTDPEALRAAVAGCSGVVHLAALVQDWGSLPRFERVNVQGTRDLLDAAVAAGVGRFLLVSSMAVHLDGDFVDGTEDAPRDPRGNAYAWSKIRCEDLLAEAHASGRIETVVVRPAMIIYGEWDTRSLPGLLPLLRKGRMPVSGTDRRLTCAVYAGNLAHGIRLALESPAAAGRTYVITDDTKLTWGDFFDGLADAMGVAHPGRTRIPAPLAAAAGTVVEAVWALLRLRSRPPLTRYLARLTCRDTHFACDRAKAELSYAPVTSPGDALRATVRWYASA
jgi:nucleoside-diphosphate-sugar epimerase